MKKPIKAYGGNGAAVIYEFDDGTGIRKKGGSIGWRSSNPGNIESGGFAKKHGGIGNNGRFAIFPNFQTGKTATYYLLKKSKYNSVDLSTAFYTYAPPTENDTEAYIAFVLKETGFHRNDPMAGLNTWKIVEAIIKYEGYSNAANHGEEEFIPNVTLKNRYIWKTQKDNNVRREHAKREGIEFKWDKKNFDHPGEAHGCRCWAEAIEYSHFTKKNKTQPLLPNSFQIQILTR